MDELLNKTTDPESMPEGHERSDVRIRPLGIFLGVLVVSMLLVGFVVQWMFGVLARIAAEGDPIRHPLAESDRRTPGPLLQVSPRQDLEVMRAGEQEELATAGWINREQGIARMPIDRAIELTADRGLPEWPAVEVDAGGESERESEIPAARTPEGTGVETPVEEGE
jgi:hypothetical protein